MLRSTFALLATTVFLAGRAQAGNAYIGCLNADSTSIADSTSFPISNPAQQNGAACAGLCAPLEDGRYGYSAWYPGAQACDCLAVGGPDTTRGDLPDSTNWVRSIDTSGTCSPDDAEVWRLNTAWENAVIRCANTVTLVSPASVPRSVSTTSECFTRCARYRAVTINPSASGTFACRCGAGFSNADQSTCGQLSFFIYGRTVEAAASGVYRRSMKEKAERQEELKKRHQFCPKNHTACNIAGSVGYYECMDTSFELESCGGCTAGEYGSASSNSTGTDCSRTPGVPMGATSCIEGKCVAYACKAGWTLQGGKCVKGVGARRR